MHKNLKFVIIAFFLILACSPVSSIAPPNITQMKEKISKESLVNLSEYTYLFNSTQFYNPKFSFLKNQEMKLKPQPITYKKQENTSNKLDVSYYMYNVMVIDGIDKEIVREALCYIPNIFRFYIIDEDPTKYIIEKDRAYENKEWVIPTEPRTIIIFDGSKHGYNKNGAVGYYHGDGKCSILYYNQTPYKLAWLIEHECLHEALENASPFIDQDAFAAYIDIWNDWLESEKLGHYATDNTAYVSGGWIRLKQDFLVYIAAHKK